jgi:hypothetical protein
MNKPLAWCLCLWITALLSACRLQLSDQTVPLPAVGQPTLTESLPADVSEPVAVIPGRPGDQAAQDFVTWGANDAHIVAQTTFLVQPGTPQPVRNLLSPDQGCAWAGIGGQVFKSDGLPITGLVVELTGSIAGKSVYGLSLTGSRKGLGPGGYLVSIEGAVIPPGTPLQLRILNLSGIRLSPLVTVQLPGVCETPMLLLNFVEATQPYHFYFPLISQRYLGQVYLPSVTK